MDLKPYDALEIRDSEGDVVARDILVGKIEGDVIHTSYGKFLINGEKNLAGQETFSHIADPGVFTVLHAVLQE